MRVANSSVRGRTLKLFAARFRRGIIFSASVEDRLEPNGIKGRKAAQYEQPQQRAEERPFHGFNG